MRFDTVLFELEGVLADTTALRRDALRHSLAEDTLHFTDGEYAECCTGLAPRAAAAALTRRRGTPLDEVALDLAALRAERHFAAASGRGLSLAPGARELVEALAPHARLGVVTRAARRDVELVIGLAGLEHAIETLVTGDDRVAPKPDPEPYVRALARLARRRPVSPASVLVLEDGVAGIASATAAGLTCVAVGPLPAHEAMRAAGVLPSLVDVTPERLAHVAGGEAEGAR